MLTFNPCLGVSFSMVFNGFCHILFDLRMLVYFRMYYCCYKRQLSPIPIASINGIALYDIVPYLPIVMILNSLFCFCFCIFIHFSLSVLSSLAICHIHALMFPSHVSCVSVCFCVSPNTSRVCVCTIRLFLEFWYLRRTWLTSRFLEFSTAVLICH